MKLVITRWKLEPLKPKPFSPVHRARKFSAVLGTYAWQQECYKGTGTGTGTGRKLTTSARSSMVMLHITITTSAQHHVKHPSLLPLYRPSFLPPADTSKYTLGLLHVRP